MTVSFFLSSDRLTAFVLRSFAQAKSYIPMTVDVDILESAVEFLFTRQNQGNGLFFERGRVIHDEMQVRDLILQAEIGCTSLLQSLSLSLSLSLLLLLLFSPCGLTFMCWGCCGFWF